MDSEGSLPAPPRPPPVSGGPDSSEVLSASIERLQGLVPLLAAKDARIRELEAEVASLRGLPPPSSARPSLDLDRRRSTVDPSDVQHWLSLDTQLPPTPTATSSSAAAAAGAAEAAAEAVTAAPPPSARERDSPVKVVNSVGPTFRKLPSPTAFRTSPTSLSRVRSSSDDGSVLRTGLGRLGRVCSFVDRGDDDDDDDDSNDESSNGKSGLKGGLKGDRGGEGSNGGNDGNESEEERRQERRQAVQDAADTDTDGDTTVVENTAVARGRQVPKPVDGGFDTLKGFAIERNTRNVNERAGFRLLTCNDQFCSMQKIPTGVIKIPHLTKTLVKCKWMYTPRLVLIVKKPGEPECADEMLSLARFLTKRQVTVVAEDACFDRTRESPQFVQALSEMAVQRASARATRKMAIDFCICIGGDGTNIWLSHLFPRGCPPVVSVHMGSLGFLSPFAVKGDGGLIKGAEPAVDSLLRGEATLTMRTRLEVEVLRRDRTRKTKMVVLNEVVIDRGPNSSIVHLELYVGDRARSPITHVNGDGIIVATPTGSTAYSLSAGGSMVHPSIPCVVVTPVCPHSLSFRPIVVSDTSNVTLRVPLDARTTAWVSFDGKTRIEVERGEMVVCKVSEFPIPYICAQGESDDWFRAIKESFSWNQRVLQKAFTGATTSSSSL